MPDLRRSLRFADGLAMVVGIMVGAGIFRTPGLVAAGLGRAWLTFVAWVLGGALAALGALVFAELATRHPRAGGKYVYVREAFGRRAGFVVGWVEGVALYPAAIAAIGVVAGEYVARLAHWPPGVARVVGTVIVALFVAVNLIGVGPGRWVQNVVTTVKVIALLGVVAVAFAAGHGAGWGTALAAAPAGGAVWGALAVALQAVIWTYYGYPEAAKIAEEVVEPSRTLPRIFIAGIAVTTVLYLLLNAAFLEVLPLERIAASNLVAGDVAMELLGDAGGAAVAALALVVVLASLNGNVFVTPRVVFGLAREGLGPAVLARVNRGGTPWSAMLLVGAVALVLAATGTFEQLLVLAIAMVLMIDGVTVLALLPLRRRQPAAPFRAPFHPLIPVVLVVVYAALLAGMGRAQPRLVGLAVGVLAAAYGIGWWHDSRGRGIIPVRQAPEG